MRGQPESNVCATSRCCGHPILPSCFVLEYSLICIPDTTNCGSRIRESSQEILGLRSFHRPSWDHLCGGHVSHDISVSPRFRCPLKSPCSRPSWYRDFTVYIWNSQNKHPSSHQHETKAALVHFIAVDMSLSLSADPEPWSLKAWLWHEHLWDCAS